ncbi:MAG: cytochrome b/b6 domain-containing protein [Chromatiales bacterium]|jgi:Ni/Fe-hydrogenase 1 B-type cytochrome subunit
MQTETINRVHVWSRWLRLAHWSLTVSIFGLLASGWLLDKDPVLFASAQDYHFIFAALMLPALLLRLYLLFAGKGTDHLHDCELDRLKMAQAWAVIRFYLTLGRAPLPKWYAHNPLWGPVYLLLFLFLTLSAISGLALSKELVNFAGISMYDLHWLGYYVTITFVCLHLPAVFSHDLSGTGSDISAMINGYRIFLVGKPDHLTSFRSPRVAVDDLFKPKE